METGDTRTTRRVKTDKGSGNVEERREMRDEIQDTRRKITHQTLKKTDEDMEYTKEEEIRGKSEAVTRQETKTNPRMQSPPKSRPTL